MKEFINTLSQILCPPGDGVYTIHTAADRKSQLKKILYGDVENPLLSWKKSLKQSTLNPKKPYVLGVCSDCGGGIQRGANWGPLFLRDTLYSEISLSEVNDLGDIRVIPHLLDDKYLNQTTIEKCKLSLYGDAKSPWPVSPLSITKYFCDLFYQSLPDSSLIALGGDHSVSYPLVKSYLEHKKKQGKKVALIHFDAHTDLLTERLGIDLCFGSWVPHILSDLTSPDYCYQIGIRSSGQPKEHWQNKFGIQQFWAQEISDHGVQAVIDQIKNDLKRKGVQEVYISFDIDALDSSYASSTGTPEINGLEPHQAVLITNALAEDFVIGSCDLVEVAPFVQFPPHNPVGLQTTLISANQILMNFIELMGR